MTPTTCKFSSTSCSGSSRGHYRHIFITIALLVSSLTISLFVRALENLLNLVGGFSAVGLAFVMPSLCHLKLGIPQNNNCILQEKIIPVAVLSFGLIALVGSTLMSIVLFIST